MGDYTGQHWAGTETLLDEAAVKALQARLRGVLDLSGRCGCNEQARKVWNGMINKWPALIARCTGVADVIHAGAIRPCFTTAGGHALWQSQCCRACDL